jgi:hypothetical protein
MMGGLTRNQHLVLVSGNGDQLRVHTPQTQEFLSRRDMLPKSETVTVAAIEDGVPLPIEARGVITFPYDSTTKRSLDASSSRTILDGRLLASFAAPNSIAKMGFFPGHTCCPPEHG